MAIRKKCFFDFFIINKLYQRSKYMNNNIRIKTDDDYDPIGDCEPYDQYIDDKLTGDESHGY